jgi:hypothetical protein
VALPGELTHLIASQAIRGDTYRLPQGEQASELIGLIADQPIGQPCANRRVSQFLERLGQCPISGSTCFRYFGVWAVVNSSGLSR